MGGSRLQGAFSGVNKLCQQCVKECKQFKNVTVVKCKFVRKSIDSKMPPPLQARESMPAPITGTINEGAYVGMGKTSKDTLQARESTLNAVSTESDKNA